MPRVAVLLALALASAASAQVRPDSTAAPDSVAVPLPADTSAVGRFAVAARDTVDTAPLVLPVPQAPAAEGGLEQPVRYVAVDSLRITLAPRDAPPDSTGDVVSLFGSVQTEYEGATITAGRVDYDARQEVIRAQPIASDSGDVGVPQFSGEEGVFQGRTFVYNLRSQRGRVTGARTEIEQGYLLGGILKQRDEHVVFAQDAAYTTCELDHPHYAVEAGRIKVVDGERVYTGPVRLRLLGIPMPLILPFGYFPAAEGRRSGPLPFTYGQQSGFGLYLEDVGWYWAISDYLDAQLSGKIGTEGSFEARGVVNYARRYAYNGSAALSFGRLRSGESTDPNFSPQPLGGIAWNHNQDLPGGQRITARVNLQTQALRRNAQTVSDQISASTSSTVSYTQQWPSVGRSLNVSALVSQNFATDRTEVQLPRLTFSQQRVQPLRRGREDRWFERIALSYSADVQNAFQYQPGTDTTGVSVLDALLSPTAFRQGACPADDPDCDLTRFNYQVIQRVPINASFQVPRFNLTLTPSVDLTETWVDESVAQRFDPVARRVEAFREPGFTAVRQIVVSAAASTELYGTFPIRIGALNGIRHTVSPRVSLNYQPDYSAFGFVREVQVDTLGTTRPYAIVPGIPTDPTRSLSYSLGNTFVARTTRVDSTGEEQSQTRQILSLNVSSGYNFAAERLRFLPVSANFTSQIAGFNATGNLSFSAYAPDTVITAPPLTYFDATGRPLRLTSARFSLNRSFQSSRRTGARDQRPVYAPVGLDYDPALGAPRSAAVGYVDFSAPWSVALGLTVFRSDSGLSEARTTATLDVTSFRAQLTPNWSIDGSTGIDLTELAITQTRLGLRRDLHCWEMAINWQPIGVTRLFSVSLYVKSGFLSDFLRLDIPNSRVRSQGLGGFGQRF